MSTLKDRKVNVQRTQHKQKANRQKRFPEGAAKAEAIKTALNRSRIFSVKPKASNGTLKSAQDQARFVKFNGREARVLLENALELLKIAYTRDDPDKQDEEDAAMTA
jgi:hypothetical protein